MIGRKARECLDLGTELQSPFERQRL
ncbi:hypothetical protein DSM3645_02958 [Blastopirellula marina DSM 3645]|uniref:Uncharacterized protein n=1 Tax=Blastopirellula marina DSM 3645 TaxID=314230 RepID=A3ZVQ5_9BACT|nr:hypothetical protein DSM3645_02958 [Blastopirellula marina DSM 3645]